VGYFLSDSSLKKKDEKIYFIAAHAKENREEKAKQKKIW